MRFLAILGLLLALGACARTDAASSARQRGAYFGFGAGVNGIQ